MLLQFSIKNFLLSPNNEEKTVIKSQKLTQSIKVAKLQNFVENLLYQVLE